MLAALICRHEAFRRRYHEARRGAEEWQKADDAAFSLLDAREHTSSRAAPAPANNVPRYRA